MAGRLGVRRACSLGNGVIDLGTRMTTCTCTWYQYSYFSMNSIVCMLQSPMVPIERETAWNWDADWLSRLSNGVYCVVQQVARSLTPMSDVLTRQLHTHFAFNKVYARRTYDYRCPFPTAIAHLHTNGAYCLPVRVCVRCARRSLPICAYE